MLTTKVPHGTLGGYTNHKCRCAECRAAKAGYMRVYLPKWRARRRAAGLPA